MKNKRDWAGLVGGGILLLSLFMPWISAGAFSENAVDIKYGYILLLCGAGACLIAAAKIITKNPSKVDYIYPVLGVLSALVLYFNYGDLARRAENVSTNLPFLSDFIHGFIGDGVYIGMVGCAILIGSLFIRSE